MAHNKRISQELSGLGMCENGLSLGVYTNPTGFAVTEALVTDLLEILTDYEDWFAQ
jgi:hypothetical protein